MRKLLVTCECGQRLQVPYSALGKTGACATCGRTIQILPENARREPLQSSSHGGNSSDTHWQQTASIGDEARTLFGKAVDLFNSQRYAEALAIFDSFAQRFPGNPDIEQARLQCLNGLRRSRITGPTMDSIHGVELNADTVKQIILEKLLYGPTPAIQLQAAHIACQILGLYTSDSHLSQHEEEISTIFNKTDSDMHDESLHLHPASSSSFREDQA